VSTTRSRRIVAAATALAVLATVVLQEALTPAPYHHARSVGALALMATLGALVLVFVPRVRSVSVAVGGGIAAGGALAMFVSGIVWSSGIPDPLVGGDYAFNLADVAIVVGDVMLLVAAVAHAWDNRHGLHQPV
jgi:lipoprotein signal peptidase